MSSVITSLKEISQHYTVFAKDQVLTDTQLNSVTDYLDDQQRLTRTALSGVGIVEGLVVSANANIVSLSKGLGITRDGDLFANYAALQFDRIKAIDEDGPEYPPFMDDGKRLPIFQLVEKGERDDKAIPLSQSNQKPSDWLYILFAESYIEDSDLCTGTSCDNGSRTYHSRMRLLAISYEYVEYLFQEDIIRFPSERESARIYPSVIQFSPEVDTQNEWFSQVRNACNANANQLSAAFKSFWPNYRAYLQPFFDANPSATWQSRLQSVVNKAKTENARLQYYYEFLSDLSEAWNSLIDELEQVKPGLLVAANNASKHLLLGGLDGQGERSEFVAAPIHARGATKALTFYIEKITTLLSSFGWTNISALKVTPSDHREPSLPGYYSANAFGRWSKAASDASRTRYLLGYNAHNNQPLGGAESPLNRRQASFDFYRVEGVLNKVYGPTLSQIKRQIKDYHLPISVTGVLIEGSFFDVITPIFPRNRELNKFGYLLKKDLSYQLQDVRKFSGLFKNEVVTKSQQESLIDGVDVDLGQQVQIRDSEIQTQANMAISLLQKPSLNSEEKVSFTASLNNVVKNAGLFKNDVAKVSTTHFPTMFDQIITNPTNRWIDWLDILQDQDEKEEKEQAQLPNFLQQYPGFEVSNGVVRGGTLVLIYNSTGNIVGTGMLSHYIPMPVERVPLLPELPKFDFALDALPLPGIQVIPSFEVAVGNKFNDFSAVFTQQVDDRIANTTSYLDAFRDSIDIVRDIYVPNDAIFQPGGGDLYVPVGDEILDGYIGTMAAAEREIQLLDNQIMTAASAEEKVVYENRKKVKQEQLAEDIAYVASYVEKSASLPAAQSNKVAVNLQKSGKVLVGNDKAVDKVKKGIKVDGGQASEFMLNLNSNMGGYLGF